MLPAVATSTARQWWVPCPWCHKWHYHAPEPGDRAAHCINDESPFLESGYIVVLDPERALELAELFIPRRRRAVA